MTEMTLLSKTENDILKRDSAVGVIAWKISTSDCRLELQED